MTHTAAHASPCGFDPGDPAFRADPYPTYARLREQAPLAWYPARGWWLVSRHAEVDALLRDRRLGRVFVPRRPTERFAPWNLLNEHAMLELEPPDHTRLRRLVSHAFTPRRVAGMRTRIRELADGLVDGLVEAGGGDLLATLAEPLPVAVIAELLGIEGRDRDLLRPWSNAIVALYEPQADEAAAQAAVEASVAFTTYLDELIVARRSRPGDDLLSALVALQVEGDRLSREELIATAVLLLNAGHEASVNVLGNGVAALLEVPGRYARLVADPGLAPRVVEEAIRYDGPLSVFTRTAFEDVEVPSGTVRAGEVVALLLGSANRDPAVFDAADDFVVDREVNPHVGFGAGIHFCLGAALARVELQEAFTSLAERAPGLHLTAEPPRREAFQFRGYRQLPVGV